MLTDEVTMFELLLLINCTLNGVLMVMVSVTFVCVLKCFSPSVEFEVEEAGCLVTLVTGLVDSVFNLT